MNEAFSVRLDRHEDTVTIVLSGEVDLAAQPAIADAMTEALTGSATQRLIVDLSAVTFIDSSGLSSAIVLPARAAQEAGISFKAISGPGAARALEVSGLDTFVQPDKPE